MKRVAWIILVALLVGPGLWAQASSPAGTAGGTQGAAGGGSSSTDNGEGDFFGSGDVEAKQGTAEKQNPAEAVEGEKLGFSGQLQALSNYTMTRNFVQGNAGLSDNSFANAVIGDFFLDARLPRSFRTFLDLNITYVPTGALVPVTFTGVPSPLPSTLTLAQTQTTVLDIREVFVDFNFSDNALHFRAGKQVLKWGTGYFWNPTDLINIQHKSFTNLSATIDGVFGLRTDVTFSPNFHLYTFINLNGVTDLTDIAYAARTEFLAGTVEFGFSGWYQYNASNQVPVFGADLTMPLFWELNLTGEASFAWGDPVQKQDPNSTLPYWVQNQPVAKVDVGLSRTFDVLNVQDRMTVMAEFFWNSDGYSQNMLQVPGFELGYFHPGYYGQYYGALFISINDFGLQNMTLSLNGLMNFSDTSAIALVGLSDSPVNNFTLQVQLGSYLGPNVAEYTTAYNSLNNALISNQFFVILSAQVNF
ncbi:MAG TPA: DUF1302 family protein [Spirochaetia bacterium]|nr:DUF1302 family protein [Spirochaetia bacterium]